jgi:hypothetical protein
VTATFRNRSEEPLQGAQVKFEVTSRPNAGLEGTNTTNSSGEAPFKYGGFVEGTDEVQASVANPGGTIKSNAVNVIWVQTCGKATVGKVTDQLVANRKRVNACTLAARAGMTELVTYLSPTSHTGKQVLKGVVYADSGGKPGTLLRVTEQQRPNEQMSLSSARAGTRLDGRASGRHHANQASLRRAHRGCVVLCLLSWRRLGSCSRVLGPIGVASPERAWGARPA